MSLLSNALDRFHKVARLFIPSISRDERVSKIKDFLPRAASTQGGAYFEANENPTNSVGVRYNRFILSPNFRLRHKFVVDRDPELLNKDFSFDFKKIIHPDEPFRDVEFVDRSTSLTEQLPNFDGITQRELVGSSVIKGFDVAKFDPDFQLFMVNLLQRNFMQFDENGGTPSSEVSLTGLEPYMSDIPVGRLMYPVNKGKDFLQSFFHFDLSTGDFALESGDFVEDAILRLKIKSHFGEREIPSATFVSSASLNGELRVNPRKFEILPVKKDYDLDYTLGNVTDSRFNYSATQSWDTFFGTGSEDVDVNNKVEFTIDRPLKQDEVLSFDLTKIVQDAVDNRSSIVRFVIRPVQDIYDRRLEDVNPYNGVGNHWFEFHREKADVDKRPDLIVRVNPSRLSTPQRRARFRR
jgi:hypothetical protein